MDFSLSDSQRLLVDSARALLADEVPLTRLQEMAQGAPPPDLSAAAVELGWTGLLVPEAQGGSAGTLSDAVLLLETMGYAAVSGSYLQSAVVVPLIATVLDDEPARQLLREVASGERNPCLALTEDDGEASLGAVSAAVRSDGRLAGRKRFVKDADRSQPLLVAVHEHDGISLMRVARGAVVAELMETVSGERRFEIPLDGVEPDSRLGPAGGAGPAVAAGLAGGALGGSAQMVGMAQRILDLVVEYACVREQSGQAIGSFQAIQHHCADMLRDLEGARYITYRAAWRFDRAGVAAGAAIPAEVAMAKAYAGGACLAVARRAHQVMGAIGYCEEHPLHLLHKRIHAASLDFGDAATHLDAIAQSLGLAGQGAL